MARERIHNLPDIARTATYFFTDAFTVDETGKSKHLTPENLQNTAKLAAKFEALTPWDAAQIEQTVRELSEELGIKVALLVHPTRMLVSGQTVGPSLWELLEFLGKERVLRRMARGA
jgi:glutamyl/glutaminyl-tRNA synthetase